MYSPEQIHLISIVLDIPERIKKEVFLYKDTEETNVVDLVVYESVFNPFLTAELSIMEDQGIISSFKGTEKIVVTFKSAISESMPVIVKSFRVDSISDNVPVEGNPNLSLMKLHLLEDVAYFDKLNRINKGYQGFGENIVRKIARGELNKEVVLYKGSTSDAKLPIRSSDSSPYYYWKPSYQGDLRYIAPWQTPLEIIQTVLNRMTTTNGFPYFCYSTLNQNKLVMTDLESILERESFNPKNPFVYSRAAVQYEDADLPYVISGVHESETNHSHLLARLGAYGSRLETIHTNSSNPSSRFVNMESIMNDRNQLGLFKPVGNDQKMNIFDDFTRIYNEEGFPKGGRTISQHNSAVNFMITGDTIDRSPSSKDKSVLGFAGQIEEEDHILKVIRSSMLRYLLMNYITIQLPGLLFSTPRLDATVGNVIDIKVLNSDLASVEREITNAERSGSFMILRTKHVFNVLDGLHNVQMDVAKVGEGGE